MVGRLYSLFRTAAGWRRRLVHFVEVWTETAVICWELCENEVGPEGKGQSVEDGGYE